MAVLDAAEDLAAAGLRGALVSWAFEHCGRDPSQLEAAVTTRDDALLEAVNARAELFEMLPGNHAVGRAAWPAAAVTVGAWGGRGAGTAASRKSGRSAPAPARRRPPVTRHGDGDGDRPPNRCPQLVVALPPAATSTAPITSRTLFAMAALGLGLLELGLWWRI